MTSSLEPVEGAEAGIELTGAGPDFKVSISRTAPILADHEIGGNLVLPGVAQLELARAAGRRIAGNTGIELRHAVWLRPLSSGAQG